MTREPAMFLHDPATGLYLPANKVATTLAAQLSRMRLTETDIRHLKIKGWRAILTNGEEINVSITA